MDAKERLKELGWAWSSADGVLRRVEDDRPYDADADFDDNYMELAEAISNSVVELLTCPPQSLCLVKVPVSSLDISRTVYASEGALEYKGALLLLVPGITCRAGVWGKRLCAEQGLKVGSMLPFLQVARSKDMAQIVFDPNNTDDPHDGDRNIQHCCHAWMELVERASASSIFIVAHSFGGAGVVDMLHVASRKTLAKVRGVAFTDSVHCVNALQLAAVGERLKPEAQEVLRSHGLMWQADGEEELDKELYEMNSERACRVVSAGVAGHADTNAAAMQSIFRHFDHAQRRDWSGSLWSTRPHVVLNTSRRKFAEQENAGKNKGYGAVGELDYEISGYVWDCSASSVLDRRSRVFGLSELMQVLRDVHSAKDFRSLRVMDLGCGDGQSLWQLNQEYQLPWSQLVGVTAEDMRGVEVLDGVPPFDLRARSGGEADNSYILWNIEELPSCPALKGRRFDVIVSWITWCWLTDGMGALEMIHDRFLAPGGVLLLGSMQLLTGGDPTEDSKLLVSLANRLATVDGLGVDAFVDGTTGVYSWWVQRKVADPQDRGLQLGRFIRYHGDDPVHQDSKKAIYKVNRAALDFFAEAYERSPVPSTRVRVNDDALDAQARQAKLEKLAEYRPIAQFDIGTKLQAWFDADPCKPGQGDDSSLTTIDQERVLERFRQFDRNGDGKIEPCELAALLKRLEPDVWTDERIVELMTLIDIDKDGVISVEEFISWAFSCYSVANKSSVKLRSFVTAPLVPQPQAKSPARGRAASSARSAAVPLAGSARTRQREGSPNRRAGNASGPSGGLLRVPPTGTSRSRVNS